MLKRLSTSAVTLLVAGAALGACVDAKKRFDEFDERVPVVDASLVDRPNLDIADIDGTWYLAIKALGSNLHLFVTWDITISGDTATLTGEGEFVGTGPYKLENWAKGSAVVLDVKGENFRETSRFRASIGDKVFRFAPTDWDRPTHRYNPLARIAAMTNPEPPPREWLTASRLRARAGTLGLRPTKARGQNFVVDANTVRRIVRLADVAPQDVVVEVGPGLGSLTLALLPAVSRVVAVEIDDVLAPALAATVQERRPDLVDRLEVVHADALRVSDLPGPPPTALVANLPYNVSVPVLLHLLETFPSIRRVLVMVQLEVADRLAAGPGSKVYGVPSVKARWYGDVGRVGTGFTEKDLADTRLVLSEIEVPTAPASDVPAADAKHAHWVEPILVGEVSYGVWTNAGRLRMPVWRGWRPGKTPDDIVQALRDASGQRVGRMVLQGGVFLEPLASFPMEWDAAFVKPTVGYQSISYSLDEGYNNAGNESPSVAAPLFSLDTGYFLERDTELFGASYLQTLEPRVYYLWVDHDDHEDIPNFDSQDLTFGFSQLFRPTRFSGHDRIADANQITAALTSRLLDPQTGEEYVRGMVGQRYYLAQQHVTLPGEPARPGGASDFLAALSGRLMPNTYADVAWQYDPRARDTERFVVSGRWQPDFAKVLNASYRYTRDHSEIVGGSPGIRQVDFSGLA